MPSRLATADPVDDELEDDATDLAGQDDSAVDDAPEPEPEPIDDGRNDLRMRRTVQANEPEPVAEPPAPESWVSQADRVLARRLSISDDELSQFGSRDEFARLADVLDRQQRTWAEQFKPFQAQQPPAPAAPPAPEDLTVPNQPWLKKGKYGNVLNAEYFQKEDGANMDEASLALVAKLNELESWREQVLDTQAAEQEAYFKNQMHDALDSLSPEYFGQSLDDNGYPAEIAEDQFQRRNQIEAMMPHVAQMLQQADAMQGRQHRPLPINELARRTAAFAFGDAFTTAAPAAPAVPVPPAAPPAPAPPARPAAPPAAAVAPPPPREGIRAQSLINQSNKRRSVGTQRSGQISSRPLDPNASRAEQSLADPRVQAALAALRRSQH